MKFKTLLITGLAATVLAVPAFAQTLSENSRTFVEKAAISNMFEIQSSQLALDKAQRQDVREFAQTMITDHTKAGENLKATVSSSNIDVQVPKALDEKHREKLKDLQDAEDFDEQYVEAQIKAHEKAISLFEDYVEDGENQALHQFASQTLPVLRQHEARIKQIEETE